MRTPPSDLEYDPRANTRPAWIDQEPAPPDRKSGDYHDPDFWSPAAAWPTTFRDYYTA